MSKSPKTLVYPPHVLVTSRYPRVRTEFSICITAIIKKIGETPVTLRVSNHHLFSSTAHYGIFYNGGFVFHHLFSCYDDHICLLPNFSRDAPIPVLALGTFPSRHNHSDLPKFLLQQYIGHIIFLTKSKHSVTVLRPGDSGIPTLVLLSSDFPTYPTGVSYE